MKKISKKEEKNSFVTVSDMNNLGYGVAHLNGKAVFVQHGVDGDEAEIKIIKSTSDYDVARIEKLITPSPHRCESGCSVSRRCGGCIYTGISYEHELELKRRYVQSVFRKAGLGDIPVSSVLSTGNRFGYRNKLQLPVGKDKSGRTVMGYYAVHSHEIIPSDDCPLQSGSFDGICDFIKEYLDENGIDDTRHVYLRTGTDSAGKTQVLVCLVVRRRPEAIERFAEELRNRFPHVSGMLLNYNTKDTNVILGDRFETVSGEDTVTDSLCGIDFRISPASFYQVNHDAAELAYRLIAEKAEIGPGSRVLDLYCGIGTIGLSLCSQIKGISLTGVEIVPDAVENAKYNAGKAGFVQEGSTADPGASRARFLCGDAKDIGPGEFDTVIVDPPRKGCSTQLLDKLASLGADRLAYMSCNPATLARDVAYLMGKGFSVNGEVTPVDMFPCTGHVECVALLQRKN